jgi:hypothetical protein
MQHSRSCRSDAERTAYASFLLSERNRYLEDKNLEILKQKGYEAIHNGDWISEGELESLPGNKTLARK